MAIFFMSVKQYFSMDDGTTIDDLKNKIRRFCEDRDWDQYHNAKDLAIGIITESSELLEYFRFKTNEEVEQLFKNPKKKSEMSEELADIFHFVLRLAQYLRGEKGKLRANSNLKVWRRPPILPQRRRGWHHPTGRRRSPAGPAPPPAPP